MAEVGTVRGLREMGSEPIPTKKTCTNKSCKVHERPEEVVELPAEEAEQDDKPRKRAAKKAAPKPAEE